MYLIIINITIFILLSSFNILAAEKKYFPNKLNSCSITPTANNDYEPKQFRKSNNLLTYQGKEPLFCGQKIIIHGRVLDQNCIPVPDAKIYLWQANCSGKYPYQPLKEIIDSKYIKINNDSTFTGNGTATTDNNGEFHFVTIYPHAMHDLASHVNIKVEHYRLGNLQTLIKLPGKRVDDIQDNLELAWLAKYINTQDVKIYDFDIVLPGHGIKKY